MKYGCTVEQNVEQAVPFFWVKSIEESVRFYVDGLGCKMGNTWVVDGKLRWCWLQVGSAALMLQEYDASRVPSDKVGVGVSISFQCKDALAIYREVTEETEFSEGRATHQPSVPPIS